jgi:hypothetical protein
MLWEWLWQQCHLDIVGNGQLTFKGSLLCYKWVGYSLDLVTAEQVDNYYADYHRCEDDDVKHTAV